MVRRGPRATTPHPAPAFPPFRRRLPLRRTATGNPRRTEPTEPSAEPERIVDERVHRREVLLLRPIGYPAPLALERVHLASYRRYGFRPLDVPPAPVPARADPIADTPARPAS